jgi:hypothetical protein
VHGLQHEHGAYGRLHQGMRMISTPVWASSKRSSPR